jgi:hypothetical protein
MGAHAWWRYNMPMFMALIDPKLVGRPPFAANRRRLA